jgi:hypothetical protein
MKTQRIVRSAVLAAFTGGLLLQGYGCGGAGSAPPPPSSPPTITTSSLPTGVMGQAYNFTLQATGGAPPYTWSIAPTPPSDLPAGMSLGPSGQITGIPQSTGSLNVTIQVTDSSNRVGVTRFLLVVAFPLGIDTSRLQPGNVGLVYNVSVFASGGINPFTFGLAAGSGPLPPGLTFDKNGNFTGTPTSPGIFNFTIELTDSGTPPQILMSPQSIRIDNKIVVPNRNLPVGLQNRPYQATLQAFGGTAPYFWSFSSGQFPDGLTLNPGGSISGTPTNPQFFSFFLTVTDSSSPPQSLLVGFGILIQPPMVIQNPTLPDGAQGSGYPGTINVGGGIAPFTLQLTSGTLPPGISLLNNPPNFGTFQLSGIPTQLGTFSFTVKVQDSFNPPEQVTKDYSIRVNPLLAATTPTLPAGVVSLPYSFHFTATGGLLPLTWTLGNCPGGPCPAAAGMIFDPSTGTLTGPPTEMFHNSLTVIVGDASAPPQQVLLNPILVVVGQLKLTTSSLPLVATNVPLSATLGVDGGISPYTWSVSSGALPAGLTLSPSTGQISGTPTQQGTSNFTVKLIDSGSASLAESVTRVFTLAVKAAGTLGRNDTIPTATPLSNGTYQASISPFVDPPTATTANPDNDYYQLAANPGAMVTIEITAERLLPSSPLDSVIEIVDINGTRLNLCSPPNLPPGPFNQPCMNDDMDSTTLDSKLFLQVLNSASGPLTLFVRVLDFRGDARPDFLYNISISGAN